jgi:nucleoside-diphosphate-sugar epimerase
MSTVVITGASGFVGRECCRRFRDGGWRVIALARRPDPAVADRTLAFDLGASGAGPDFGEEVDAVLHLAGRAHALAETASDHAEYERINVEGTRRLVGASVRAGVRAFVLVSTVKVFGEAQQRADRGLEETDPPAPDSPYGRSKLEAERIVLSERALGHRVVLRPALMYGADVKGNLARLWNAVAAGRFPPLPETGMRRSLVHRDDAIGALEQAVRAPAANGNVFHVTDGCPLSAREMLDAVRLAQGRSLIRLAVPVPILRCAALAGDLAGALRGRRAPLDSDSLRKLIGPAWFSSARIEQAIGWRAQRTFGEAVRELAPAGSNG